jgi:hypothetical protein
VKNPTARLLLGTDDKVKGHFLRLCKAMAKQAGMDPAKRKRSEQDNRFDERDFVQWHSRKL